LWPFSPFHHSSLGSACELPRPRDTGSLAIVCDYVKTRNANF
jgi:hypothetical protein